MKWEKDLNRERFEINYTGHETNARKLLLEKGIKTEKELAMMNSRDVEQAINAEFEVIQAGEDWLLIPHDKESEFNALVTWIDR